MRLQLKTYRRWAIALLLLGVCCSVQAQRETPDGSEVSIDPVIELQAQNGRLRDELARLRKAVATTHILDRRNQTLEAQMIELEREVQLMRQETRSLRDRTGQDWFIRGAAVMLAGMLVGVLICRLNRPKAPRWSDL